MENNDPLKGYKIRWIQAYNLNEPLSKLNLEMIARKMIAEINEHQMLEDSEYREAKEVIKHIKSL